MGIALNALATVLLIYLLYDIIRSKVRLSILVCMCVSSILLLICRLSLV